MANDSDEKNTSMSTELKTQYQEIEKQMARTKGRRDGKYTVEIATGL